MPLPLTEKNLSDKKNTFLGSRDSTLYIKQWVGGIKGQSAGVYLSSKFIFLWMQSSLPSNYNTWNELIFNNINRCRVATKLDPKSLSPCMVKEYAVKRFCHWQINLGIFLPEEFDTADFNNNIFMVYHSILLLLIFF